mmetsp:Transcript_16173/g.26944  ORF Transcript_16173/g.26944 Transcript_16173/m.26944 type:complete len:208 (+) Transcript_16173:676-1299(+)
MEMHLVGFLLMRSCSQSPPGRSGLSYLKSKLWLWPPVHLSITARAPLLADVPEYVAQTRSLFRACSSLNPESSKNQSCDWLPLHDASSRRSPACGMLRGTTTHKSGASFGCHRPRLSKRKCWPFALASHLRKVTASLGFGLLSVDRQKFLSSSKAINRGRLLACAPPKSVARQINKKSLILHVSLLPFMSAGSSHRYRTLPSSCPFL